VTKEEKSFITLARFAPVGDPTSLLRAAAKSGKEEVHQLDFFLLKIRKEPKQAENRMIELCFLENLFLFHLYEVFFENFRRRYFFFSSLFSDFLIDLFFPHPSRNKLNAGFLIFSKFSILCQLLVFAGNSQKSNKDPIHQKISCKIFVSVWFQ